MSAEELKEYLEVARPFMRWGIMIIYGATFLFINRMFVKDEKLRAWIMQSFLENGKTSGKALTGFVFVQLIAFATIAAIVYAENHLLPEYFLISLLTFIASLYGIKFATQKWASPDTTSNATKIESNVVEPEKKAESDKTKTEDKKSNQPVSDDEIG